MGQLNVGDIIYCHDADDRIEANDNLINAGYVTEDINEDGKFIIKIIKAPEEENAE